MGKRVLLPLVFVAAFSLPIAILALYGRIAIHSSTPRELFPHAIAVNDDGVFLRVAESELLDPVEQKDALIFLWFKLRRLPEPGQKMTLVSRVDDRQRARPGYAIVISGEKGGARYHAYWRNSAGKGGWYQFSDTPLRLGVWTLVAMSFSGGRYLGMHTAFHDPGRSVEQQLAGGHDLGDTVLAAAKADLIIGAPKGAHFRGSIGPFGVFIGKNLSASFKEILKSMAREPLELPPLPSENQARLLVFEGLTDQSGNSLPIELEGAGKARRK